MRRWLIPHKTNATIHDVTQQTSKRWDTCYDWQRMLPARADDLDGWGDVLRGGQLPADSRPPIQAGPQRLANHRCRTPSFAEGTYPQAFSPTLVTQPVSRNTESVPKTLATYKPVLTDSRAHAGLNGLANLYEPGSLPPAADRGFEYRLHAPGR